jgi:serine/threonine protein kinase
MAPSLDSFTSQLVQAGVLSAADLSAFRDQHSPADINTLVRTLVHEGRLTAYQAQQVYAGRANSLVLGNYLVIDKLGQGGMGIVLKAQHRRMNRYVALKILSPDHATPEGLQRFQREVEAVARLQHPNIVAAFDADSAEGTHFLVMEYVAGIDLSALIKKTGPMPVDQAVNCVIQAARGLEFAHRHGVIHRDVKPANLVLDQSGTVKVLDMGLARFEGESSGQLSLTNTGAMMGTIDYMSPEQALDVKNAGAQSDIYSLGMTLWFLLTARAAYGGDSQMGRRIAHATSPIPSLREAQPDVPVALEATFLRMVAKQPEDRFPSMIEVIDSLETCQCAAIRIAPPIHLLAGPSEDAKFGDFMDFFTAETEGAEQFREPIFRNGVYDSPSTARDGQTTLTALRDRVVFDPHAATRIDSAAQDRSTVPTGGTRSGWNRGRSFAAAALILSLVLGLVYKLDLRTLLSSTHGNQKANLISPKEAPGTSAPIKIDDGWIKLFNGRDLSGWTQIGNEAWTVHEGVLLGRIGTSDPIGWLMSDREFADFELQLEYRLASGSNSGIFLRAFPKGDVSGKDFCEIQLLDDAGKPDFPTDRRCGSLFGVVAPNPAPQAPADAWNRVHLELRDKELRLSINEVPVLHHAVENIRPSGRIGLQLYHSQVEFRGIRIRPISAEDSPLVEAQSTH